MQVEIQNKSYRICPKCSFFKPVEKDLNLEYCEKCGNELSSACPKCKLIFTNPFARYCKRCGEYILDPTFSKNNIQLSKNSGDTL